MSKVTHTRKLRLELGNDNDVRHEIFWGGNTHSSDVDVWYLKPDNMEQATKYAKLFAAAPELLEALKDFMKYYESDFFKLSSEDGRTQASWIGKAQSAIKKAESL